MQAKLRVLTSGESHFFGFHDITPWNPEGTRLVCLRVRTPENRLPGPHDVADVIVIQEGTGSMRKVGETRAWNWQQGARQRFIGDDTIVFNHESPRGTVASVVNLTTGKRNELALSLSDVNPLTQRGVTVDFGRLRRLYPAYGYASSGRDALRTPADDGLFGVDLDSGRGALLLSIEEVASAIFGDVDPAADFFTHASFSPSGQRVSFLHRRNHASGAQSTNLIVYDLRGRSWSVIADDSVSHFDWEDDECIVVWCRKNRAIGRLKRSPLFGAMRLLYGLSRRLTGKAMRRVVYGESFRRISVDTGRSEPIGLGVLDEDGHPMVNPRNPRLWVNDTYPDEDGRQTLMLFNSDRNARLDILQLPTQPDIVGTGWRCDFHPRWDPSGTRVCIDSAHLGRRQLCVLNLEEQLDAWGVAFAPTASPAVVQSDV